MVNATLNAYFSRLDLSSLNVLLRFSKRRCRYFNISGGQKITSNAHKTSLKTCSMTNVFCQRNVGSAIH